MKKGIITAVICCLIIAFSISPCTVYAASYEEVDQIPYDSYTYWQYSSNSRGAVFNKPIYKTHSVIDYLDMGLASQLGKITDIVSDKEGYLYILDSSMSQVIILDENYKPYRVIDGIIKGDKTLRFKEAQGIFVDNNGYIYISNTENAQVIVCDKGGKFIKEYLLPDSNLIPSKFNFRPIKSARDSRGYMYILSDGSYNGAILYSPDDEFLGFYGANKVKTTVTQVLTTIWNKLVMTDEKRAASAIVLPFQFTDICIDKNDFVFTATGNTSKYSSKGQIRKLSPGGKDVIDSNSYNYADEGVGTYQQDLCGITVDGNGFIYAIDSSYGHIFAYDQENNLLGIFGTGAKTGLQDGSFTTASAITSNGSDVIVCDSTLNTVTIFKETDYGRLLKKAQLLTNNGDYITAKPLWESLIKEDKQNQLSYKGLAKAYYDEGDYNTALDLSKMAYDRETYASAFKELRNKRITDNFAIYILIAVVAIALIAIAVRFKKKKKIHLCGENVKLMFSVWRHPGDAFENIKLKAKGSVLLATIIVILYYVTDVMKTTMGGFCFTYFNSETFNALITLLRTSGLIFLFVICFWAVSALMSGQGKMKEIYIVVTYSMQPLILFNLIYIILTNVMIPDEIGFLNILMTVMILYSGFLAIRGLMRINDYSFGRLIAVTTLTVVGMIIVVFIGTVIFLLLQLLFGFIRTIATEIYKIISFGG